MARKYEITVPADRDAVRNALGVPDISTVPEAEAGSNNTKTMTPLRTKQSIDVNAELANFTQAGTGAVTRSIRAKLRDFISVADFGAAGNGTTDDGPAIQAAIDAASAGAVVYFPATGSAYRVATAITVNKCVEIWLGGGSEGQRVLVSGAITAFTLSGAGACITGGRIYGDRTASQKGIYITAAYCNVRNVQVHLLDYGIHVNGGNHQRIEGVRLRNIRTTVVWLQDGVGPRMHDVMYDTDVGTYAQPITAGIHLQTEGVQISDCDFIRAGNAFLIEVGSRVIYWMLCTNTFFDTSGGAGITIRNNSGTHAIYGLFFNQTWSATADGQGLLIEGTGVIDGVYFSDCPIHNNDDEGVRITRGRNIYFNDCMIQGNSRSGTASNIYLNSPTTGGVIAFQNTAVGRAMGWTSTPDYEVRIDSSQAGKVKLSGLDSTTSVTTSGFAANSSSATVVFADAPKVVTASGGTETDLDTSAQARLTVDFTAIGSTVFADAGLFSDHDGGGNALVSAYLQLRDVTGGGSTDLAAGVTQTVRGSDTNQPDQASLSCRVAYSQLVPGRTYRLLLWVSKGAAIGPIYPKGMTIQAINS